MKNNAFHGKQMAQDLHSYSPTRTICITFPLRNQYQWKDYMEKEIMEAKHKSTFQKRKVIESNHLMDCPYVSCTQ